MKIMILNTTGNVGKTTLTRDVIYDRNRNYEILEIETQNSSYEDYDIVTKQIELESFASDFISIIKKEDILIDVGSSDTINFLEKLAKYGGLDKIDRFIVPTTTVNKQFVDTQKTIMLLISIFKVDPKKIFLVVNNVDAAKEPDLSKQLELAQKTNINFNYNMYLYDSALITYLYDHKILFSDYKKEEIDYLEEIKKEDDEEILEDLLNKHLLQMLKDDLDNRLEIINNILMK